MDGYAESGSAIEDVAMSRPLPTAVGGEGSQFAASIEIAGRSVGPSHPVLVVAELSANHQQDLSLALATIDAAHTAGADAIKLQTYKPDTLTYPSDSEIFRVSTGGVWDGRTLYDLYSEAQTPWEWHAELFQHARALGLLCFSSPFDPTAVDLLESLEAPAYKIASFEITDTPLIRKVAATGKPVIISTGIATLVEIEEALAACISVGNRQVIVLKCTSAYPARTDEANLLTMVDIRRRFGCVVGLSDHTISHVASTAATALGASFLEKHLILERSSGGPDSGFSLEPDEFAMMVALVRETQSALGEVTYELGTEATGSRSLARSLFVVKDVLVGDLITDVNVKSIRPSNGLQPKFLMEVVGRRFVQAVAAGTPLSWDLFEAALGDDHQRNR